MSVHKTIIATLLVLLFATSAGAVEWVKVTDTDSRWATNAPFGYDPTLDGLPPGDDRSVIAPYSTTHYAEITLYASQIQVYGITSDQGATADISIDGQVKATPNWYSVPSQDFVLMFDSGTLAEGAHTLRLDNSGDWTNIDYLMVLPGPDYDPPTPDPMTWETVPYASGDASVTMVATTASDPSGVEYYFACTSGGGHDSGWQDSPTYRDGGLTPATQYCYQVKARDKGDYLNETAYSTPAECATTHTLDTTPPTPDPMTWKTVPHAVGPTFIAMEATTASDTSGVEYYFDNVTDPTHDSGWQLSPSYLDEGLSPENTYTYTVTARDRSYTVNYTAASTAEPATTPAYVPLAWDWALKGHRREWRFNTFASIYQGFDTFNEIKADLDYIMLNGINELLLYCAYHGNPDNFNGCSPVDYYTTTPASGTPAELQSLIDTAHSKGLAVSTYFCLMYLDDTAPFWLQAEQDMGAGLDTHYTRCFAWGELKKDVVFHSDDSWCDGVAYSETAGKWYGTSWDLPGLDFSTQDTMDESEAVMAYWGGYGLDGYMMDYPVSMGNCTDATRKWLLTTLPRYYGANYLRAEGIEVEAHMNQYMENVDMNFIILSDEGPTLRNIYGDGWTGETTGDFETWLTTTRDPIVAYHEEAGAEMGLSEPTDILPAETRTARMAQEMAAFGGAGVWCDAWYGIGQWGRKFWPSDVATEVAKVARALNNSPAFETAGERYSFGVSDAQEYACHRIGRNGAEGLCIFQCTPNTEDVKVTLAGSAVTRPSSSWDIVNDVAGPDITDGRTQTFTLPPYGYLLLEIVGTGNSPPSLPPPSGDAFISNIDLYTEKVTSRTDRAIAIVTIEDEGGRPVQGARVYVDWLGDYIGSDVGSTNTLGNVRFNTPAVPSTGITVAVTNVVDQEYTYNPALNVESCESLPGGPPCPGPRSPYANGESTAAGTVSGDYTDTHASDNVYEAITERVSGGKPANRYSYLEHTWTFDSDGGTFSVEAYHTANTEGDDFVFAYSDDGGQTWTDMLTVIKTSDDNITQTYGGVPAGAVDVRVKDLDQTAGNTVKDTIYVDFMSIE